MKKLWLCSLFLPFLAGCALISTSYVEPAEHDMTVSENPLSEVRFEIGTFRNLSGSDRRFLYREKNGRMISDDYNRWLLSPDLMVERQLHKALSPEETRSSGRNGTFARISGTIYRFDFDRERRKAILSVDYTVRVFTDRKPVRSESMNVKTEETIRGNTPDAAAAAMSECMEKSIAEVRSMLIDTKNAK
ncbi:MAG: hypothetical protein HPZ91_01125 [Lentisphaeria bacterium]|nr:hypothetical protein [Lentisphaeria bacterium]